MKNIPYPWSESQIAAIRSTPWLSALTSVSFRELRKLIDGRCAGISSPWVRDVMIAMLRGSVVGLNQMKNKYYIRVKHPDGGPDHFVPEALSAEDVLASMPNLNLTSDVAEIFGLCNDMYIASTSCKFADFQQPETFLTHRNAFDTPDALQVLDARCTPHSLTNGPIDLAAWFIFFYDGSGQVLGMNEKLEIAWYLHDHQRIIIMPMTVQSVFQQMIQTLAKYPWFHAFESIDLAGVSFSLGPVPNSD